jgi:class 3 adenylate cyclase
MQPKTQYTKSGEVNIAYQVLGNGPFDTVFVYGLLSHLDFQWTNPAQTGLLKRLASFSRVIVFDKRGTGLSDPVGAAPTFDDRMDDVRAVMDAGGSREAAVFGYSEGGVIASLFAASYPERCRALILYETWACGLLDPGANPGGEKWLALDRTLRDNIEHWGEGRSLSWAAPSQAEDELARRIWASFERAAVSPSMAMALWEAITSCDIRAALPAISAPTLVLAHKDSRIPVENAEYLADHIPAARLVVVPGEDHVPTGRDLAGLGDEIEKFLTGRRRSGSSDRLLATVMLTDIVGSTRKGAELGDAVWRQLRERHDSVVREHLTQFGGREVKQTGDGFLAVFDGAARAVECASAMIEAIEGVGIHLRIGVHTGECELIGSDITGMAVNIAARIAALAGPSEILVSRTVRDLVVGSGLEFVDAGSHELKGVEGDWQIFRATHRAPHAVADPIEPPSNADRVLRRAVRHAPGVFRFYSRLQERRSSSD